MRRRPPPAAVLLGLFLLVATLALGGATQAWDVRMLAALRLAGRPDVADVPGAVIAGARALTWLGTGAVRAPVALAGALVLWLCARPRDALALLAAWAGESLLVELLKAIAQRPRPDLAWRLVQAGETSFPSGHAAGAMLLYPLLGCLLGRLAGERRGRRVGAAFGVVLAIAIGATRILLGVHWASDVIAGWLLGGAMAVAAARTLRR